MFKPIMGRRNAKKPPKQAQETQLEFVYLHFVNGDRTIWPTLRRVGADCIVIYKVESNDQTRNGLTYINTREDFDRMFFKVDK